MHLKISKQTHGVGNLIYINAKTKTIYPNGGVILHPKLMRKLIFSYFTFPIECMRT